MDNSMEQYLIRHSKKRDSELKYDFMPAMLEIIERPAHKAGTVIILGVFTLLIAAVVWACLSQIDMVVMSPGTVQPVGSISSLNAYTSGTVKAINVEDGAYVQAGDVLIELDTQSIDIDVEYMNGQQEVLEAQREILTMIRDGKDPSGVDVSKYSANLKPYILTIIDTDQAYRNNLSILEGEKKNAALNREIAQIKYDDYKVNPAVSEADYNAQELVLKQAENEYLKAETNILNAQTAYSEQINASLSEISGKLKQAESELEKYRLSLEYQKITAPVNGYINSIAVHNIGETVTASQQIITLVPADAPVEMVCYVKNMYIADIKTGMEAAVKLEAYPYNKYGTVRGTVRYISPSSFSSEQAGSVYLVKLDLENTNPDIRIMSGLTGTVEVKVGRQSVLHYFLDPIVKGFGESLKEN